ncbi:MAG: DUF1801 domain-containing protein [Microbacteriaceae bacterium]|nr:DUF1801 domain-containing protein [Microbacteriaceae bacterium]
MAAIQTQPTDASVDDFLAGIDEPRRSQAQAVRELMERVTGVRPVMWGPAIVGFGSQHYEGRSSSGEWPVVGLSPRKGALTLYGVYSEYGPADPLMDELGPHTTGKGCLYLKRLDGVDLGVLERLVRQAWERAG